MHVGENFHKKKVRGILKKNGFDWSFLSFSCCKSTKVQPIEENNCCENCSKCYFYGKCKTQVSIADDSMQDDVMIHSHKVHPHPYDD